jgi:hypothetical protein
LASVLRNIHAPLKTHITTLFFLEGTRLAIVKRKQRIIHNLAYFVREVSE